MGVLKLLGNSTTWRWQSLNKMNNIAAPAPPGKQILQCYRDTSIGNSQVPLHIYNLTAFGSNENAGEPVGYFMSVNDTGNPQFSPLSGQGPAGTDIASQPWYYEAGDVLNRARNAKYVRTEWININLNLYGCTTQPTYYDVLMVRFERAYLDPLETASNTLELKYRSAMWQTFVRNLVTNPINMGNADNAVSGMKVLRRYRLVIQPSSSTDQDLNPESRVFRLFYKDGRMRNHDYGGDPIATDTGVFDTGYTSENMLTTQFQNNPKSGARLYLIVRASNTTSVLPASVTRADTPSYDICMRKKCWISNLP